MHDLVKKLKRKTDKIGLRREVVAVLKKEGSLRLNEIAHKIGRSTSGVFYQLTKLTNEGMVIRDEQRYYRLTSMEEIEKAILRSLLRRRLSEEEILKSKELEVFDRDALNKALERLRTRGYIEETIEEDSGTKLLSLSQEGSRQLGVCYYCNQQIGKDLPIVGTLLSWELSEHGFLHPKCVMKYLGWEFISEDQICAFCGLPLSRKLLDTQLSEFEFVFDDIKPFLSKEEKSAIEAYKQQSGEEPIWSRKFSEYSHFEELLECALKGAEEAQIDLGNDYTVAKRIHDLWMIFVEKRSKRMERLTKLFDKLSSPIGSTYSEIYPEEMGGALIYDSGDHFLAYRDEYGHFYHMYCAQFKAKNRSTEASRTDRERC